MTSSPTESMPEYPMINRELSWLAFNHRVLQEAMDESVPLIERVRFLGIFSNNRDEFFRVRIATLHRLIALGNKGSEYTQGKSPLEVLREIQKVIVQQEAQFLQTYRDIIKKLRDKGVFMIDETQADESQLEFVRDYFRKTVRASLVPIMLNQKRPFPFLKGGILYLAIKLYNAGNPDKKRYAIMEVPTALFGRFLVLPQRGNQKYIMLLEDVIRAGLDEVFMLFDFDTIESYTVKVTRDAELDIDDDISKSLIDKLSKSIKGRVTAKPTRFVYDSQMPPDLYTFILKKLKLEENDNIIAGGRYHNFKDFIGFPSIGAKRLRYDELAPQLHPFIEKHRSLIKAIAKKDILIHNPYQPYRYVIDVLREAAIDPKVKSIKITLYRMAPRSQIVNALINAVRNGKSVTVLVELHARFDEEANILWAQKMQEEGVNVIHGVPGLKVHCKLFLIDRKADGDAAQIAYVGTGNFHEGNARIYEDYSLLTANPKITQEVSKVFDFFDHNYIVSRYASLFVSPFSTRRKYLFLIDKEIDNAEAGKPAWMIIKLNSLLDEVMIKKLYQASQAGVKIKMIVRGICALIPGVEGLSENIEVRSIVDRYLEHSRVQVFANGGEPKYFISSADWMGRNLDRRVEVTVPIYDPELQQQIQKDLDIMLSDNTKARMIDAEGQNPYFKKKRAKKLVRAQYAMHEHYTTIAESKQA